MKKPFMLSGFILLLHIVTYCEGRVHVYTIDGDDLIDSDPRTPTLARENKTKTLCCYATGANISHLTIDWYYQPDQAQDTTRNPGFHVAGDRNEDWCGKNFFSTGLSNNMRNWCLSQDFDAKKLNLVLKNVQKRDEGVFTCVVKNFKRNKYYYGGYKLSVVQDKVAKFYEKKEQSTEASVQQEQTTKAKEKTEKTTRSTEVVYVGIIVIVLIVVIACVAIRKCKTNVRHSRKILDAEADSFVV